MSNTFFWSFENNSLTLDSGGVDFSAGDTVASTTGSAAIQSTDAFKGTFAGGYDTSQDTHDFDAASIFDYTTQGSFGFMFKITAASAATNVLLNIRDDAIATNIIRVETANDWSTDAGGILIRARRDGGGNIVSQTGDIGLTLNTWYGVVVRVNAVTEEMEFSILSELGAVLYTSPSVVSITNTIGSWTLTGTLVFRFGNYSGLNPWGMYIDNMVFGSGYSDAVQDWIFFTDYSSGDFSVIYEQTSQIDVTITADSDFPGADSFAYSLTGNINVDLGVNSWQTGREVQTGAINVVMGVNGAQSGAEATVSAYKLQDVIFAGPRRFG